MQRLQVFGGFVALALLVLTGGAGFSQNTVGARSPSVEVVARSPAGIAGAAPGEPRRAPVLTDSLRARLEDLLRGACAPLLLTPADLSFRDDYEPADAFRLSLVSRCLVNPRRTPAVADSLIGALTEGGPLTQSVRAAALALDAAGWTVDGSAGQSSTGDPLRLFENAVLELEQRVPAGAFVNLDADEHAELLSATRELLTPTEPPDDLTIDELAAEEARAREVGRRFVELALRMDRGAILEHGHRIVQLASEMLRAWLKVSASNPEAPLGAGRDQQVIAGAPPPSGNGGVPGSLVATGDVVRVVRLGDGRPCVLGGRGRTFYHQPCALIIDLGGDDVYLAGAAGTGGQLEADAIAIDLGGNDLYRADEPHGLAAGTFGTGILIDVGGDDVYEAQGYGIGAGLFGVGVLFDRDGDDRYLGHTFSQGAGAVGFGLLRDAAGRDLYQGSSFCQGFGFVGGLGLLDDGTGSDVYICQSRYKDLLRDETTALHLAQGFAYGLRPWASGGIGLLVDGGGHDRYVCEVFGQGGAYWYGLGALIDAEGNDRFEGFNYTQGSGVHLALGVLIDGAGQDIYRAKGVSQGCGHDLGFGGLIDLGGDDRYDAEDLGLGAGSANGVGSLLDLGGDNRASSGGLGTTLGYGNFRRHYGSVGLAVFADGNNRFLDEGARPSALWKKGVHGLGVDAPAGVITGLEMALADTVVLDAPVLGSEPVVEPPPYRPLEAPIAATQATDPGLARLGLETLFQRAARGEPRFAAERQAAFEEIVRRGREAVPTLARMLETEVARERHTLKDLFRGLGEHGVGALATALADTNERVVRTAAWCLERMEAQQVEAELVAVLATHASWRARAAAAQALARSGGAGAVVPLAHALRDTVGPVRKAAAFALGEIALAARRADTAQRPGLDPGGTRPASRGALEHVLPRLFDLLDDPFYGARFAAARALGAYGPWATVPMVGLVRTADPNRRALLAWAMGEAGDERALPVLEALARGAGVAGAGARLAAARLGVELEPPAVQTAAQSLLHDEVERAIELSLRR